MSFSKTTKTRRQRRRIPTRKLKGGGKSAKSLKPSMKETEDASARCMERNKEVIAAIEESMASYTFGKAEKLLIRVKSIDGMEKDGQFYITAEANPLLTDLVHSPDKKLEIKVVVGSSFLKNPGEKKAKIACPGLLKVGAAILIKEGVGTIYSHNTVVGRMGGSTIQQAIPKKYSDLLAVLSEEEEARWISSGYLKDYIR